MVSPETVIKDLAGIGNKLQTECSHLKAINADLLAALENVVFHFDGEAEDMVEARAAIAKAKGD